MGNVTDLVGWGILATGHIASVFARDLALLRDEARLVAVGSRSLEKAMAFAADHGIPRAYDSYVELAGDPDVDVVYVASPHHDHFASAKLCLFASSCACQLPTPTCTPCPIVWVSCKNSLNRTTGTASVCVPLKVDTPCASP